MTDIVLVPVTGGSNLSAINSNFDKIEEAINTDVLHLKGGNNVMKQDLDLNGHQLLNHETDLNDPDSLINVGDADARYYNVSGDALAGNMNAAGNKILNLPVANAPHEPMRKNEVDAANAAQDAVTAANNSKTIRTPEAIPALGNAASRADKLLSFDSSGNPVAIAAANQSATDLELRLANSADPTKGAALVGFSNRTVKDKLVDFVDVADYGADGVGDETTQIQAAVTAAIANGKKWIRLGDNLTYTVTTLTGVSQVNFVGRNSKLSNGYYRVYDVDAYGQLRMPSDITSFWTNAVYMNSDCSGSTDFDVRSLKPSGQRYYVRHTGGASGNDGLTFATAVNSINVALGKANVAEIILQPGDYPRTNNAVGEIVLARNIYMGVLGNGRARIFGCDLNLVWAVNGTFGNVYQTAIANTSGLRMAWDSKYPDSHGDFMEYSNAGSLASVSTTPGSFFWDGAIMYVRTIDDRAPDVDIRVWRDTTFRVTGPFTFYTENIDFVGIQNVNTREATASNAPLWVGVNCTFGYSDSSGISGSGSFRTEGGNSILVNCTSYKGARDGFNYHWFNSTLNNCGWHVEIGCIGRDNGATGLGNNQGSTIHDGGKILRINGRYERNEGPNLEDVNTNTVSYNVGCFLGDSYKITTPRQIQSGSGALMYCVGLTTQGRSDFDASLDTGGTVKHYKCSFTRFNGPATDVAQFNPVAAS